MQAPGRWRREGPERGSSSGVGVNRARSCAGLTADRLRSEVESRLARFKQPRHYAFVDHLPRNAMGKVQKNLLREDYRDVFQKG